MKREYCMMIKKYSMKLGMVSALISCAMVAQAIPTSEVTFAKGGDCGAFEGDLTSGRYFTVTLKANQALVVKTDGHVQSVEDSQGNILEDLGGTSYRYVSKHSGTHTLKMVGRVDSVAEFCIL